MFAECERLDLIGDLPDKLGCIWRRVGLPFIRRTQGSRNLLLDIL
jgi:hypothetical protein